MKKLAAALLAACLALSPCGPHVLAYAAETAPVLAGDSIKTAETDAVLEVKVYASLQFPYKGKVSVQVSGAGIKKVQELDITGTMQTAEFQLPKGEYTVTVRAEGFAVYEQAVQAETGWIHRILLSSSRMAAQGGAKAGWLRAGDVDQDGTIGLKDKDALLAAVREKQTDPAYDLNGDGNVDLADLKFLAEALDESQEASIQKAWASAEVLAQEGTVLSGSPDSLFQDAGSVRLKPKKEEPVSESNPIQLQFTLSDSDSISSIPLIGGMTILTAAADGGGTDSQISDGSVQAVYMESDGKEHTLEIPFGGSRHTPAALSSAGAKVKTESDGSLVFDFGGQAAVKRVIIRITGTTKKEQPLVEITKVEFVNNMEDRIPEPKLDIPSITSVTAGDKSLALSWKPQANVTGYRVWASGPVKGQGAPQTQVFDVSDTALSIGSINGGKLVNYKEYKVKVCAVNGTWTSPWSEEKAVTPVPQDKPAPPDDVKAEGGYRSISVSWKAMDDSDGYMVYYKASEDAQFLPAAAGFTQDPEGSGRIFDNSFVITGLKEHASYTVYVISWNALGWSGKSLAAEAQTKSEAVPHLPSYRLLNTSNGEGKLTAHIKNAAYGGSGGAKMTASPLDTKAGSAFGLVDNDFASYWHKADWDDGVSYDSADKGMTVTLDKDYEMNYFTFAAADQKAGISGVKIWYGTTADASAAKEAGACLLEKKDENDNPYYIVRLDQKITADKIRMCLGGTSGNIRDLRVGEIHFHRYDPLEDDILDLYTDVMHTTLREDVTEDTLKTLEKRLETPDAGGEKHPLYHELALELQTAGEILNGALAPAYELKSTITAKKDSHLGFGGLNAWQPLGRTAAEGETLLVYVGHNTKKLGDTADVRLEFTQHYAQSSGFCSTTGNLKIGRNEITVPKLSSLKTEHGGQIYAVYTGNNASDKYALRISGGSRIPVLDVCGMTKAQRTAAVQAYVRELESYVGSMEAEHARVHAGIKNVDCAYDAKSCILNATDIMLDEMLYSLPASQIYAGIKNAPDKAAKLNDALDAMDKTMTLFYQHKGLSNEAGPARGSQALPSQHLNIRYMRMFAGAFMYASGNHIGIEWDSAVLAGAAEDWDGFGWGIAHEIGHNINQAAYAHAEVTNNYFAQLLTGKQRYTDEDVYEKVTSGTIGHASNVFTQLALYWQLHLAFDDRQDDRHIYDDYEDQFANLFFARVDTYARNPQSAPKAGLKLDGSADQNLMRLSCAAAEKNILSFFERWGMVPDPDTTAYASQYETETKALYYVNQDARDYRLAHPDEKAASIAGKDVVKASAAQAGNKVTLTITSQHADNNAILGYEIIRSMIQNGKKTKPQAVGFQPAGGRETTQYIDTVSAVNNRVLTYEVRAVDKYLNYSNAASAGSVKVQTGGVLDKSAWTVETNMASDDDVLVEAGEGEGQNPDSGYDAFDPQNVKQETKSSIVRIIDHVTTGEGVYRESAAHPVETAEIVIDMHKTEEVAALKYEGSPVLAVTVKVSVDGKNYQTVKSDYKGFADMKEDTQAQLYLDALDKDGAVQAGYAGTYDARYVKLLLQKSGGISIREIEICGPSGDNIEFDVTDAAGPAAAVLSADWKYGSGSEDVIPKGSLVFTGAYKGNPAYNVVMLYDENGSVIGKAADGADVQAGQVILAPVPEHGELGETADGSWVYYIKADKGEDLKNLLKEKGIKKIRAELYRTDSALSNEGERMVSDTYLIDVPDEIPAAAFTGNSL